MALTALDLLAVSVASGGAVCTLKFSRPGAHAITAHYGGDANFTSSSSNAGFT